MTRMIHQPADDNRMAASSLGKVVVRVDCSFLGCGSNPGIAGIDPTSFGRDQLLDALHIHDSSIAAKRRTAKFDKRRILATGFELPASCSASGYSLRSKHQISVPPPGWLFTSRVAPIIAARSRIPVRP
jgi:hypothetical protein